MAMDKRLLVKSALVVLKWYAIIAACIAALGAAIVYFPDSAKDVAGWTSIILLIFLAIWWPVFLVYDYKKWLKDKGWEDD